jgi:hypothetical protein
VLKILRYAANRVHVVIQIPLAVGLRVSALSRASEANPARPARLSVLNVGDKIAGPGASATVKSPGNALAGIVYNDFPSPTETRIARTALDHLSADIRELLRTGPCGLDRAETFPRHIFDFAHFSILPKTAYPIRIGQKGAGLRK